MERAALVRGLMSDEEWGVLRAVRDREGSAARSAPAGPSLGAGRGVFWIARTGAPWRDLHDHFGKWSTVYRQFRRWTSHPTSLCAATGVRRADGVGSQHLGIRGPAKRSARRLAVERAELQPGHLLVRLYYLRCPRNRLTCDDLWDFAQV
jgi:transposase